MATKPDQDRPLARAEPSLLRLIELGKPFGRGAMGTVYAARVHETKEGAAAKWPRQVAVRVLSSRFYSDPGFMSRFYSEAHAARRLQHPNLVRVLDVAEISGRHCLAMELVEGLSLDQWIEKRGKLAEPKLLVIAGAVAGALKDAHDQERLVHRAIRPQNLFVDHSGGLVRVGDVGLARAAVDDQGRPMGHTRVNDPHYTAPELMERGRQPDCLADIYALGATLYHLATGTMPFDEFQGQAALEQHHKAFLRDPKELNPRLSDGFCRVLEKMMARQPADRYARYEDVIADLRSLTSGVAPSGAVLHPGQSVIARGKAVAGKAAPKEAKEELKEPVAKGEEAPAVTAKPAKVHHHPAWMTPRVVAMAWVMVFVLTIACWIAWKYRQAKSHRLQIEAMQEEIGQGDKPPTGGVEDRARHLLSQADAYVRSNPADRKGIVRRYEAVAEFYSNTEAGRTAKKLAEQWRGR